VLEALDLMRANGGADESWTHDQYLVQAAAEELIEMERVRLAALPRR
jgi:hypothetical protein